MKSKFKEPLRLTLQAIALFAFVVISVVICAGQNVSSGRGIGNGMGVGDGGTKTPNAILIAIVVFMIAFSLIKPAVELVKFISVNKPKVALPINYRLLKVTSYLFSPKTQKEVFKPIVADWEEEYSEALFKKEIWKARWINVRYLYAFLGAMWQKSPLGDLIEFINKIAK